jgi:hypothetical protein
VIASNSHDAHNADVRIEQSGAFNGGVRDCSRMRVNGMDSSKEDINQHKTHDRGDKEETPLVPTDLDVDEGDEEKREETDLPPAMPPKV